MGWKQRILTKVVTRGFLDSVKREVRLVLWRIRCFAPRNLLKLRALRKQTSLKLNLGGGNHSVSGWTTIDLVTNKGIRWDVRWGLPVKNASVTHIHCEHFLEHLDYPDDAKKFLKECHRALKPGAEFRLIVPDAQKYIRAYSKEDTKFWGSLKDLGGGPVPFDTEIEIMNQAFRMGGDHLFAYDTRTLKHALAQAGFHEVSENTYSPQEHLDLPDSWRLIESLYLTVVKT